MPPVFVVPPLGNLISGNLGNGVLIDMGSPDNVLNGNFIGTTASGDAAIGNPVTACGSSAPRKLAGGLQVRQ